MAVKAPSMHLNHSLSTQIHRCTFSITEKQLILSASSYTRYINCWHSLRSIPSNNKCCIPITKFGFLARLQCGRSILGLMILSYIFFSSDGEIIFRLFVRMCEWMCMSESIMLLQRAGRNSPYWNCFILGEMFWMRFMRCSLVSPN